MESDRPCETERRLRGLLAEGQLELPLPASGETRERFHGLQHLAAREDLSVARLAEAHCDAAAIVAECERSLPADALAGVWASRYGGGSVNATPEPDGSWRLSGRLRFCSGAALLDAALVDARLADGRQQLFLVPLRQGGLDIDGSSWRTPALAATETASVDLDVVVDADAAIGEPDFYLSRPGFWHGAIGVAACWAGGGRGVHEATLAYVRESQLHAVTNVGRSAAACWAMTAMLDAAARDIDSRPADVDAAYALTVRQLVATACDEIVEASRRATGPGPAVFDATHSRRIADLRLYVEQQHYEADLAEIGTAALRHE